MIRHVFRSCTDEEMPLLEERMDCLQAAGNVLQAVRLLSVIDSTNLAEAL